MPGGALSADGKQWLPSGVDFIIPVAAASIMFRAKFHDEMKPAGLLPLIPPRVWRRKWVVNSKAVGEGRRALQYLAPYVFRVAITNRRIVAVEDGPDGQGQVTFTYRKSGSNRPRKMPLTAHEFLRRFLQHVLPRGYQKVRHYGFAAARQHKNYDRLRWLVSLALALTYLLAPTVVVERTPPLVRCAECGGPMLVVAFLPPPLYCDTS